MTDKYWSERWIRDPDYRCHECGAGPVQYDQGIREYYCLACKHTCHTTPIWAVKR